MFYAVLCFMIFMLIFAKAFGLSGHNFNGALYTIYIPVIVITEVLLVQSNDLVSANIVTIN